MYAPGGAFRGDLHNFVVWIWAWAEPEISPEKQQRCHAELLSLRGVEIMIQIRPECVNGSKQKAFLQLKRGVHIRFLPSPIKVQTMVAILNFFYGLCSLILHKHVCRQTLFGDRIWQLIINHLILRKRIYWGKYSTKNCRRCVFGIFTPSPIVGDDK